MHKAQPLTIGSNLLTEIERLTTDELPSPFELMRLKRDADKLLKISAVESYVVKAVLLRLNGMPPPGLTTPARRWHCLDVTTYLELRALIAFRGQHCGCRRFDGWRLRSGIQ